jgi:hypothetical protein
MPHSGLDHRNIKEMQLHLHAFDTITDLLIYAFRNLFWIKKNIFQYHFIGRQNQTNAIYTFAAEIERLMTKVGALCVCVCVLSTSKQPEISMS